MNFPSKYVQSIMHMRLNYIQNYLLPIELTNIVTTNKVTLMRPVSKIFDRSVIFKPFCGDHSPTLTNDCCFNFTKSNLN